MKRIIPMALAFLMMLATVSCKKKEVKKIAVDTQFAMALFSDTISLKGIINDMDSATTTWLRVRDNVLYAYYGDTVRNVLTAGNFLSDISDYTFDTNTDFSLPETSSSSTGDTVISNDKFATFPFEYEGFHINSVVLRRGTFSFSVFVTPDIPMMKRIELYSNQMVKNGEPLRIVFETLHDSATVNLAKYVIIPDSTNSVNFGVNVTLEYDGHGFPGGDYTCNMAGGLKNVMFNTVYGTMDRPLDSIFDDFSDIDFGINGISGEAFLPIPTIRLTYNNTFGFGASVDVTKLQFVKEGEIHDLLEGNTETITIDSTLGKWKSSTPFAGLHQNINLLAGYQRLDFGGHLRMELDDENGFSISDTSKVDVIADIEMPFRFDINDLTYNDTIDINLAGDGQDINIDNYFDEITFYIDYHNAIRLNVTLQAEFLKNGTVIETLFDGSQTIEYNGDNPGEVKQIALTIYDDKVHNVIRADKMVLKLGVTTPGEGMVTMLDTDDIFLRMKMRTKTTEITFDDILNE